MGSKNMRSLTTRGKIVVALLGALLAWGVWYLLGHIWYVPGEGYCWGSMAQCYAEEAK
jgi:hypothetical protein